MSDIELKFQKAINDNYLLKMAITKCQTEGLDERDTLHFIILFLLDIKEECFQERIKSIINGAASFPSPFINPSS